MLTLNQVNLMANYGSTKSSGKTLLTANKQNHEKDPILEEDKNKQTKNKNELKKKVERSSEIKCPECNLMFPNKRKMLPHLIAIHQNRQKNKSEKEHFKCLHCSKIT